MMKKSLYTLIMMAVAIISMTSCTHNNGDIGPWFGLWHIEEVQKDGAVVNEYQGTNFFAFQTSVFQLRYTDDLQTEEQTTGTWVDLGSEINITFPDQKIVWTHFYGIDMTAGAVNHFKVETITSKDMVLTLAATDGHNYRYTLKKWGK